MLRGVHLFKLYETIKSGNADALSAIFDAYPHLVQHIDIHGKSLLQDAIDQRKPTIVALLLKICPSLARNIDGQSRTALHDAMDYSDLDIVRQLVLADTTSMFIMCNASGKTPLQTAVIDNKVATLDCLLEANPNAINCGSLMHYASSPLIASYLLSRNPKLIDMLDEQGNTPLHSAARRFPHVVEYLLLHTQQDLTVRNMHGQTAFDVAIQHAQAQTFEIFLKSNPHLSIQSTDGDNVLHIVARFANNHDVIMNVIRANDPKHLYAINAQGNTPFEETIVHSNQQTYECFQTFLTIDDISMYMMAHIKPTFMLKCDILRTVLPRDIMSIVYEYVHEEFTRKRKHISVNF